MNKAFFESFEQRKQDFAARVGLQGDVRAELVTTTGRAYMIDRIVEAADAWVHLDVRDIAEDEIPLSIVLPYFQINFVQFLKPKPRMRQAGFGPTS